WLIGLAENIFLNHLYDKVVKTVQAGITLNQEYGWNSQEKIAHLTVQGWMKSPLHRKNILSPLYDRHGIGVAISGGEVLITEDLF
ncbi:MAG: CAP domain-containing protein, partial [Methylosarcina sp.]